MSEASSSENLTRVVHATFELFFSLHVESAPQNELESLLSDDDIRGGVVHILGDWIGSVAYRCSKALASTLTARIYDCELKQVTDKQVDDTLREISNMIGGNLKSVLGESCILSTPKTLREINSPSGVQEGKRIAYLAFRCEGEPFEVSLYESGISVPSAS